LCAVLLVNSQLSLLVMNILRKGTNQWMNFLSSHLWTHFEFLGFPLLYIVWLF
jgi:hypothetical protein